MSPQGSDLGSNLPPPFLNKCYDMVDDPATDPTVSWSSAGDTFIVWDPPAFSTSVLPNYFKHSNFSSFVRQLNTYGFRKVDPDRWQFANEGFRKGLKNLLKTIGRRKNTQSQMQQKQSHEKNTSGGACVEVGQYGLEEELERLKRDKNILMQELVKLRQYQQNNDHQLRELRKRLEGMEQHQQQMLSFFVMAMQRPGFFAQLLQQNDRLLLTEDGKKRRLPALEHGIEEECAPSGGQIVRYEPLKSENPKHGPAPSSDSVNDLFENVDFEMLGIDMTSPMDFDEQTLESDGTFVFLEVSNNELEQLLLVTSLAENGEDILESSDGGLPLEATEEMSNARLPRNMDLPTKQMELMASELIEQ